MKKPQTPLLRPVQSPPDRSDPAPGASMALGESLVWLGPKDLMARLPVEGLRSAIPGLPTTCDIEDVSLAALKEYLDGGAQPAGIISPLFWRFGDVMEAARLLHAAKYPGPYRVISPALPRPGMVEREVRSACPGLDFALIPLPRR